MAPLDKEEEQQESRQTACLAGVVIVAGVLLIVVSILGLESGALYVVDKLVRFDSSWHVGKVVQQAEGGFVMTTRLVFEALIFIAMLVVLSGMIGIVGSNTRKKSIVGTYVVLSSILTVLTLAGAGEIFLRRSVVQPLIDRQVKDLCNPATYMRLAAHMPCSWADSYTPAEAGTCGPICKLRTANFKALQGCVVMNRLCKQFYYDELGSDASQCASSIVTGDNMLYMASTTSAKCKEFCDQDIRCTRYSYSAPTPDHSMAEVCILGQAVEADHKPPTWAELAPLDVTEYMKGPTKCFQRTKTVVLEKFVYHSTRLAWAAGILGVVLLVSTISSCCLMYNVNVKRWDKPAAHELGLMMCCPCFAEEHHRKFNEPQLSDDSDCEESSDGKA